MASYRGYNEESAHDIHSDSIKLKSDRPGLMEELSLLSDMVASLATQYQELREELTPILDYSKIMERASEPNSESPIEGPATIAAVKALQDRIGELIIRTGEIRQGVAL